MVLTEINTYMQVIGCLMKQPLLKVDHDIKITDFNAKVPRIVFSAVHNLIDKGVVTITSIEVDQEIETHEAIAQTYKNSNGLDFVKDCYANAQLENFEYYFNRLKKLSLIRDLDKSGYDVSYYYKKDFDSIREENETIERFDEATINEILNHVESKYNKIRELYLHDSKIKADAALDIAELINSFKKKPEIGVPMEGELYSTAHSGARLGKMYIRTASSNTGKTRLGVFDLVSICYPIKYDIDEKDFVRKIFMDGSFVPPRKCLFITTEMKKDEIQTVLIAFLAGVEESKILLNQLDYDELDRVSKAIKIVEYYKDYFFIEEVPDPNLENIGAVIAKYATVENVKYVVYDYIFSSPSLLAQFEKNKVNEATALMMMSTHLKDLAVKYNIWIQTSTQVNAEGMTAGGFKNETCIRGSKAVIDKADAACIMQRADEEEIKKLMSELHGANIQPDFLIPTHIFDIYKMRRGQYKNVRIWAWIDLGTGQRKDLYMTNIVNKNINVPIIKTEKVEKFEWNIM